MAILASMHGLGRSGLVGRGPITFVMRDADNGAHVVITQLNF